MKRAIFLTLAGVIASVSLVAALSLASSREFSTQAMSVPAIFAGRRTHDRADLQVSRLENIAARQAQAEEPVLPGLWDALLEWRVERREVMRGLAYLGIFNGFLGETAVGSPLQATARPAKPLVTWSPFLPRHVRVQWNIPFPGPASDDYEIIVRRVNPDTRGRVYERSFRLMSQVSNDLPFVRVPVLKPAYSSEMDLRRPFTDLRLPDSGGIYEFTVRSIVLPSGEPVAGSESQTTAFSVPPASPAPYRALFSKDFTSQEIDIVLRVLGTYARLGSARLLEAIALVFLADTREPARDDSATFGTTSDSRPNQVSLLSKRFSDTVMRRVLTKSPVSLREETQLHNYEWVVAHEMAHVLIFNLFRPYAFHTAGQAPGPLRNWMEKWVRLDNLISEQPRDVIPPDGRLLRRPPGYPTARYVETNQVLADTFAYLITGARYADNDPLLMQRVALAREFLATLYDLDQQNTVWRLFPGPLDGVQLDWTDIRIKNLPVERAAPVVPEAEASFRRAVAGLKTSQVEELYILSQYRDTVYLKRMKEWLPNARFFTEIKYFLRKADFVIGNNYQSLAILNLYQQSIILEQLLQQRRGNFDRAALSFPWDKKQISRRDLFTAS